LAVQLAGQGHLQEAAVRYRRAYELMPASFGRVESHCFGCESAFAGPQAQSIAQRVFLQMIARSPRNPKLHYLMGYLNQEKGLYEAAHKGYQTAVKLDPDYLNAWKKLQDVNLRLSRPQSERETASLNLLRLDPMQRHTQETYGVLVTDLRAFWTQAARLSVRPLPESGPLLPLPNSEPLANEPSTAPLASPVAETIANTSPLQELVRFVDAAGAAGAAQ
jgi:tetratricopeptide (TPR) repeat protein